MNESFIVISSRDEILSRMRGEYLEMPGLCLTRAQAQRLWGLDAQTCASLLASLTEERFLCRRGDGSYGRLLGAMAARAAEFSAHRCEELPL
jgi:hypothetical protein